jgi:heme-binding NEAT domain protein
MEQILRTLVRGKFLVYWWEIEASTSDPTSVLCDGIKTIRFGAVEYNNLA